MSKYYLGQSTAFVVVASHAEVRPFEKWRAMHAFGACAMIGCSVQLDCTSDTAVRCSAVSLAGPGASMGGFTCVSAKIPLPQNPNTQTQDLASLEPAARRLASDAVPSRFRTWQAKASRKNCEWSCSHLRNQRDVALELRSRSSALKLERTRLVAWQNYF